MEKGELTLEQSLAQFERGVTLARQCQEALKQAEQKVEMLASRGGADQAEPLKPDE
jgi:exodeoxyribonuclease VII small subunit